MQGLKFVENLNFSNLELQLKDTESAIKSKLINLLTKLKGFKVVAALVLKHEKKKKRKENDDKTKFNTLYLKSKEETVINEKDIDFVFESVYTAIISNKQKSLGKGSGWIIDSVIDHNINISKCNPLASSNYTRLPQKLDHPRKGLINIQNINDEQCFKWCLVRYLDPTDHHPRRITKADKGFEKKIDFKDIKFSAKIRDIYKIKKNEFHWH